VIIMRNKVGGRLGSSHPLKIA